MRVAYRLQQLTYLRRGDLVSCWCSGEGCTRGARATPTQRWPCFSLTQEASLKDVDSICQQIHRIKGGNEDIPMVVVGTKMDLVREGFLVIYIPLNMVLRIAG